MNKKEIDPSQLGEKIVKVLKTIFDPEIPVDIYELGLIYDVFVNEDFDVSLNKINSILIAEGLKRTRQRNIQNIIESLRNDL